MLKRKFEEDLLQIELNVKKMKINEKLKINEKRKFEKDLTFIEKNVKKMKLNENDIFADYVNYKRTILMYL
jgi:hypothetical protein